MSAKNCASRFDAPSSVRGGSGWYCTALFTGRYHVVCVAIWPERDEACSPMSLSMHSMSNSGFFCARNSRYFSLSASRSPNWHTCPNECSGRWTAQPKSGRSSGTLSARRSSIVSAVVPDTYGRAYMGLSSNTAFRAASSSAAMRASSAAIAASRSRSACSSAS